jgi:hypothetical protein
MVQTYHAWTKEYNDEKDIQRCPDGSYHRNCDQDGTTIIIDTIHKTNPTGIGAGRMYMNEGMDGYRNNYSSLTEQPVKVRIGRPVPCQ